MHNAAPQAVQDGSVDEEAAQGWTTDAEAPAAVQTPVSMLNSQVDYDALRAEQMARESPPVKRYRVERDGRLNLGSGPVFLKAGKVVDERAYSIAHLRASGIQLAEI
jgi:hypothetical protein